MCLVVGVVGGVVRVPARRVCSLDILIMGVSVRIVRRHAMFSHSKTCQTVRCREAHG